MKTAEALAQRRWYVVDAQGKILGRMATEIARVLRGKHKPVFPPNVDAGDFVIVVNARGVKLSGKKLDKKVYYRHTEYPGGIRERTAAKMLAEKTIRSSSLVKTRQGPHHDQQPLLAGILWP